MNEILDQNGDGGDSCNFTCTFQFFLNQPESVKNTWARKFTLFEGPVRHPTQVPHNNPKNFTIDQAVPWVACASPEAVAWYFKKHWAFAPNIERDFPGSIKLPYPHEYFEDSRVGTYIDTKTNPLKFNWRKLKFGGELWSNLPSKVIKKAFDFRDPVQPNFFGLMVMRSKMRWLYPVLPLCYLWQVFSILCHCFIYARNPDNNDFKQLYIMSTFYKLDKLFAWLHPRGLDKAAIEYFIKRRNLTALYIAFNGHLNEREQNVFW